MMGLERMDLASTFKEEMTVDTSSPVLRSRRAGARGSLGTRQGREESPTEGGKENGSRAGSSGGGAGGRSRAGGSNHVHPVDRRRQRQVCMNLHPPSPPLASTLLYDSVIVL